MNTYPRFALVIGLLQLVLLGATSVRLKADEQPANYDIKLPGRPFDVAVSADQKWIFVSIMAVKGEKPGIAVLQNKSGQIELIHTAPMGRSPEGLALTHHGDMLIAAADDYVVFFDTKRLEDGTSSPAFQWIPRGEKAGCCYANITADDKTLFVSDEFKKTITVIDLEKIRTIGSDSALNLKHPEEASRAVLGRIPVGISPVALTFSNDGRSLFTTSEVAAPDWNWPRVLEDEEGRANTGKKPEGAVVVVNVAKAQTDPATSIIAKIPAGGSPVRLALSPDGNKAFVSARASDAVLVFSTSELIRGSKEAKPKKISVGKSPVPIIVVADGRYVLVGNSDRFGSGGNKNSTLTVLDTSRVGTEQDPKVGTIPCGAFPRNFCLAADGKTLFLTNYQSQSLQVIDVSRISELIKNK